MEENDDLAIGFLTGTAEGTREAARLQETHLSRRCRRESIRELVPVPKPVPAAESNVSSLVYSDPRLRSAEIKWNTSISNHLGDGQDIRPSLLLALLNVIRFKGYDHCPIPSPPP